MSAGTELLFWLSMFLLAIIAGIASWVWDHWNARRKWRYRDVIRQAPKPDSRDSIQSFKRMMDVRHD